MTQLFKGGLVYPLFALSACLFIGTFWFRIPPAHAATHQRQWEYKSIVKLLSYEKLPLSDPQVREAKCFDGRQELNCGSMLDTLGDGGWELVSVLG